MRVWKYEIPIEGIPRFIEMPAGATILAVERQRGVPTMWAEVDVLAPMVKRMFAWFGTGSPIPWSDGKYVATLQVGEYVFHLYEHPEAIQFSPERTE